MPHNPWERNMSVMLNDNSSDRPKFLFVRTPVFIVIVEHDSNAATIDIPVPSVPADFIIPQKAFCPAISADDPMIQPKDLSPIPHMAGINGLSLQMPVLFG